MGAPAVIGAITDAKRIIRSIGAPQRQNLSRGGDKALVRLRQ
jgi:hypothetical protein